MVPPLKLVLTHSLGTLARCAPYADAGQSVWHRRLAPRVKGTKVGAKLADTAFDSHWINAAMMVVIGISLHSQPMAPLSIDRELCKGRRPIETF